MGSLFWRWLPCVVDAIEFYRWNTFMTKLLIIHSHVSYTIIWSRLCGSMSFQKLYYFYRLPTRGRVGTNLGDAAMWEPLLPTGRGLIRVKRIYNFWLFHAIFMILTLVFILSIWFIWTNLLIVAKVHNVFVSHYKESQAQAVPEVQNVSIIFDCFMLLLCF